LCSSSNFKRHLKSQHRYCSVHNIFAKTKHICFQKLKEESKLAPKDEDLKQQSIDSNFKQLYIPILVKSSHLKLIKDYGIVSTVKRNVENEQQTTTNVETLTEEQSILTNENSHCYNALLAVARNWVRNKRREDCIACGMDQIFEGLKHSCNDDEVVMKEQKNIYWDLFATCFEPFFTPSNVILFNLEGFRKDFNE